MFKFDKQVDQELEEGQISDAGEDEPQPKLPVVKVVPKLHPNRTQSSDSRDYVIEKVKIKTASPPERKKDRKDHKAEEKAQYYDRRRKQGTSPDNNSFPRQQQVPPVKPYYVYPPQGVYPYATADPRTLPYMHMGQQSHSTVHYPSNSYMPQMHQWQPHPNLKPIPDYQKPQQAPHPQQAGYNYPNQMMYQAGPHYGGHQQHSQGPQQPVLNHQGSYYQEKEQLSASDQKKKQVEQQIRIRHQKMEQIKSDVRDKISADLNPAEKAALGELILILRPVVAEGITGDNTLRVMYNKLEEQPKLKAKFFHILSSLQLEDILNKLREKELEMKIIGEEKKAKAAEMFLSLQRRDPRLNTR